MILPRYLKWALISLTALAAIVVAATMALFETIPDPSKDEVARVISPGGTVDAVLVETNAGATTSFGYEVHVVPRGSPTLDAPAAVLYGAVRNEKAYGANLRWGTSTILEVEYLNAKWAELKRPTVTFKSDQVRVALREGVEDASAPSGGELAP